MWKRTPPELKFLGNRIRERREALSYSQEQLAEKADLHRTYIGSVERGERNISIQNLLLIARALQVPISILLKDLEHGK